MLNSDDVLDCRHFGECGGCKIRDKYALQLDKKKKFIEGFFSKYDFFQKILLTNQINIHPSDCVDFYRNKVEYTFGSCNGKITLGFNKSGKFNEVVDLYDCYIQSNLTRQILNIVRKWANDNNFTAYNKVTHIGLLRYLVVRHIKYSNSFLFNLVVSEKIDSSLLVNALIDADIDVKSFYVSVNNSFSDTAYTLEKNLVFGDYYIEEKIDSFIYRIGPYSFLQVNTRQIENICLFIKQFIKQGDLLIDLYSGVGGFSIYLSSIFKQIIGIESNAEAVDFANQNKFINNIQNCEFIYGKVEDVDIEESIYFKRQITMIVDPPRAGLGKTSIKKILFIAPELLVYVSCNPKSMAEDLLVLSKAYEIKDINFFDMFPNTLHIETVVFLTRKENYKFFDVNIETRQKSISNLLNIAEFEVDYNGFLQKANNSFYKLLKKLSFYVDLKDISKVNLLELLTDEKIVKKFTLKEGQYKNLFRFFDGSYGSGVFHLYNSLRDDFYVFEIAYQRDDKLIKGLVRDYSIADVSILEFLKSNIFFNYNSNIIITDNLWKIDYVNSYFLKQMSSDFHDVLGLYLGDIIHFSDVQFLLDSIKNEVLDKTKWECELVFRDKLSKIHHLNTKVFLIENNNEVKFLILQEDVTDKFVLEKNYLSTVTHFNSLLSKFSNVSSLKNLSKVSDIETITNIISEIVVLKKSWFLDVSKYHISMSYSNISELLNNVLKFCESDILAKNINIQIVYDTFLFYVYLDNALFPIALEGIFTNIMKYININTALMIRVFNKNGFLVVSIVYDRVVLQPEYGFSFLTEYIEECDNKDVVYAREVLEMHNGQLLINSPSKLTGRGFEFMFKIPIEKRQYNR